MTPHPSVPRRRGHIDGPVTRTAHIGDAPTFHVFESAAFYFRRSRLGGLNSGISGFSRDVRIDELIVEPLVPEVALFFGNPFLKASMRLNAKFAHIMSLVMIVRTSGDLFAGLNGWGTLRAAPAAELSFISTLGIDHFELSTREKHQSYSSLLSRDPIRSCHYVGRISG